MDRREADRQGRGGPGQAGQRRSPLSYVAVIGAGREATAQDLSAAEEVGQLLAQAGAVLICGGLGGVMEAACRGAARIGGATVGLLPGHERTQANEHVGIAIPTGLGEVRNALIVRSADALIALGGGYGTLSEIALALRAEKPVFGLGTWEIDGVLTVGSPAEAVAGALAAVSTRS